jgi:hypothetical protein
VNSLDIPAIYSDRTVLHQVVRLDFQWVAPLMAGIGSERRADASLTVAIEKYICRCILLEYYPATARLGKHATTTCETAISAI